MMTRDFTAEREPQMQCVIEADRSPHLQQLKCSLEQFCVKLKENSKVNVSQSTMQMLWIKASKGTKVPLITSERFFKISSPRKRSSIYAVMLNHHLHISSNHLFSRWIQPLAPCQGFSLKIHKEIAASLLRSTALCPSKATGGHLCFGS